MNRFAVRIDLWKRVWIRISWRERIRRGCSSESDPMFDEEVDQVSLNNEIAGFIRRMHCQIRLPHRELVNLPMNIMTYSAGSD
jgi:hypothetical protein